MLKEMIKEATFIKRIVFNENGSFTLSLVAESWDWKRFVCKAMYCV